jgi:hypothetical protein
MTSTRNFAFGRESVSVPLVLPKTSNAKAVPSDFRWLLHAVAWFLPVAKDGVTFPHGLPGWQAFRVAASAVWPYDDFHIDTWYYAILTTISAVTTPLFIFGSVWVVLSGTHVMRRASAWIATFAFIVNAHWCVLFGLKDLRIGYFLWWLSFLLVALGLFALSPQTTDNA